MQECERVNEDQSCEKCSVQCGEARAHEESKSGGAVVSSRQHNKEGFVLREMASSARIKTTGQYRRRSVIRVCIVAVYLVR
jgi:hypothetical protein